MIKKTFKREYAFILMGFLGYSILTDNVEMVKVIVWPVLSFVATSAGLHIYDSNSSRSYPISTPDQPK